MPATSTGGQESLFADDLSIFKKFDRFTPNAEVLQDVEACRKNVHAWGRCNRVPFDPGKEHVVIIHPIYGVGEPFKLLGCTFDTKLIMRHAIEKILSQVRPKIRAILRTRHHYSTKDLIGHFKAHVWGLMEIHNGGIFHAAPYLLAKFDSAQRSFLQEIGVSEGDAFLEHNFAPPSLRRNIGILGLLHKRVLGEAHSIYQRLMPFFQDGFGYLRPNEHNRQLYGHVLEIHYQRELYFRSIFGMILTYNKLSQNAVDSKNVTIFQTHLTKLARSACENGDADWKTMFSVRS